MKYIVGIILTVFALMLSSGVVYCIYMTFIDNPFWILVATGLFMTDAVVLLAMSAAFSAAKQY